MGKGEEKVMERWGRIEEMKKETERWGKDGEEGGKEEGVGVGKGERFGKWEGKKREEVGKD